MRFERFTFAIWLLVALVVQSSLTRSGQANSVQKPDFSQPYILLATSRTSTMEKELNEAARAGYRALAGCLEKHVAQALLPAASRLFSTLVLEYP
jgi:hypothetical protein